MPDKSRHYTYAIIGNRRTATEETAVTTYTSNNLNQYTALSGAKTAAPLHDDDGNVTDYKNMKYSWNAENQMISAEPKNPSESDKKTEYLYDYMGRRARKQVYVYSSGGWNQTTEKLFVYDGWNLIKEITKTGASSSDKFYVWGLDLSQSLQGAGGIGGLVCAVSAGEVRHYFYDGNGNVGQVVNADGSIAAHYEYDPFGNAIVADGVYAQENLFRFSTKYFDVETGLYYYGYRYYSAELGRWWSRDPIGEKGGIGLYLFLINSPMNFCDPFGLNLFEDGGRLMGKMLDVTINAMTSWMKNSDLAKRAEGYAKWQVEYSGLTRMNESFESALGVLYVSGLVFQTYTGYGMVTGGYGIITAAGGLILLGDAGDKTQALYTDRNHFREWVESMPISESDKKIILCAKEISVIVIYI